MFDVEIYSAFFSTFFFTVLTTCFALAFDTKTSRTTSKNVIPIDAAIYSTP